MEQRTSNTTLLILLHQSYTKTPKQTISTTTHLTATSTAQYTHGCSPIPGIVTLLSAKKQETDEQQITTTFYQYPIYDHRGTVVRLTDENAAICATYKTNAWGLPLGTSTSTTTNHFRYQSNWMTLDDSNGIILLSPTRLYHTKVGRFLQRDMLGFVDGLNLYRAFKGNPLRYADAEGNIPITYEDVKSLWEEKIRERKKQKDKKARIAQTAQNPFPFKFEKAQQHGVNPKYSIFLTQVIKRTEEEWKKNWRTREVLLNRYLKLGKFNDNVNSREQMKVTLAFMKPQQNNNLPWAQYNPKYDVIVFNTNILDQVIECQGQLPLD